MFTVSILGCEGHLVAPPHPSPYFTYCPVINEHSNLFHYVTGGLDYNGVSEC